MCVYKDHNWVQEIPKQFDKLKSKKFFFFLFSFFIYLIRSTEPPSIVIILDNCFNILVQFKMS